MKISLSWLREFIATPLTDHEVADLLTSAGLEVEHMAQMESVKGSLAGLVVAQVVSVKPHPNADRLRLCEVNDGSGATLVVVCGAPNVAANQKVVFARVGCTVHPVTGEPFQIREATIRGQQSRGMICAADEVGLGDDHSGILVLPESAEVGSALSELFPVYTDTVLEIGLTPNRSDAASHYGVARDVKALLKARLGLEVECCRPTLTKLESLPRPAIQVIIENAADCPRYVALRIDEISVGDSPAWLQWRLEAIGVRPINNVVDVTNYVCHALGQPLHAFDAAAVGATLKVRRAADGERLTTLDGVDRKLSPEDLVIANATDALCLAGVFGGIGSGVQPNTTSIILESAYFSPSVVRRTAKRHALHTDASFRFERGADANMAAYAALYAAKLLTEMAGAVVKSQPVDTNEDGFAATKIDFRPAKVRALLGVDVSDKVIAQVLESLEVRVEKSAESWLLHVPAYRVDVQREADVAEEILRMVGYDKAVAPAHMRTSLHDARPARSEKLRKKLCEMLVAQGFHECMSNSLIEASQAELFCAEGTQVAQLQNALSAETAAMRTSLIPSLAAAAAFNLHRQQQHLKLFEIGQVYAATATGFHERTVLAALATGNEAPSSWRAPQLKADWNFANGLIERVMAVIGINSSALNWRVDNQRHFESRVSVMVGQRTVAQGGRLSAEVRSLWGIKRDVVYVEFDLQTLLAIMPQSIHVVEPSKFPSVRRDLALVVPAAVTYAQLHSAARQAEPSLLKSVQLFDVYEGKNLPAGTKSYALALTLHSSNGTMADAEIDAAVIKVQKTLEQSYGAVLR